MIGYAPNAFSESSIIPHAAARTGPAIYTLEHIGVPLDYMITAQQAGAYKPSRPVQVSLSKDGYEPRRNGARAMGMYWDMKARHELGLRGIWVNRSGEAGNPNWLPYAEVRDLNEAVALL